MAPRFKTEAFLTCDLITLTFDLSTSKWGHRSPVSWVSVLPIDSSLDPPTVDLRSGTGQNRQTDRQTTATNA